MRTVSLPTKQIRALKSLVQEGHIDMSKKTNAMDYNSTIAYKSIKELISQSASTYSQLTAIVSQPQPDDKLTEISYQKLEEDVAATALGWQKLLNIDFQKKEGKKIALLAPNCYHWILTYLGVINLNQVIVPLDWQLPVADLTTLLQRAGVSAVVFSSHIDDKISQLKQALPKVRHFVSLDESTQADTTLATIINAGYQVPNFLATYRDLPLFNETICALLFTSGTTAEPKGVMLSHKNLTAVVMGVNAMIDVKKSIVMSILPLYHSFEAAAGFLVPLSVGATVYYLAGGVQSFAQNLQIARPTTLFLVPLLVEGSYARLKAALPKNTDKQTFAAALKKFFGGRLTKLLVGGAPLNPVIADALEELGIIVIQGYGITENGPVISVCRECANKHASIGLPLPNLKVDIHEPNKDGVGEIIVRGPTVMLGYYKNERLTDQAIKNKWLYTGDYGYIDDEGFLYVVGRKKNIILGKNGKNVYPEEIEFHLNNCPGIAEAMVYGKLVNDDVKVAALIVPNMLELQELAPKLQADANQKEIEVVLAKQIEQVNAANVKYKEILEWQIVSGIPKTPTGKIRRTQV